MAITQFNLAAGQRAERKLLITVAEWQDPPLGTHSDRNRQFRRNKTPLYRGTLHGWGAEYRLVGLYQAYAVAA